MHKKLKEFLQQVPASIFKNYTLERGKVVNDSKL